MENQALNSLAEAEDRCRFQDNALHHRFLDGSVGSGELVDHGIGGSADDTDKDFPFFQILSHLHGTDGDHAAIPFVIMLDHRGNFTAKQFVDSINTAGHRRKIFVLKKDQRVCATFSRV